MLLLDLQIRMDMIGTSIHLITFYNLFINGFTLQQLLITLKESTQHKVIIINYHI